MANQPQDQSVKRGQVNRLSEKADAKRSNADSGAVSAPAVSPEYERTAKILSGLFRSRDLIKKRDKSIIEQHGLTWGQFEVLAMLGCRISSEKLTPTQIYTTLHITSGGLTKMLAGLERRKLIMRANNDSDGRSKLIALSGQGKSLVCSILEERGTLHTILLSSVLSQEDQEVISGLLTRLHAGLLSAEK